MFYQIDVSHVRFLGVAVLQARNPMSSFGTFASVFEYVKKYLLNIRFLNIGLSTFPRTLFFVFLAFKVVVHLLSCRVRCPVLHARLHT